jgi:Uncharacterized protein conserved in bacteria (DUF2059)
MRRFVVLLLLASSIYAADSSVDIDTAAKIYQAAAVREQVRASLGSMPAHLRQLFARDVSAKLSKEQLAAVTAAAERGFRIDVFEAPALRALADNLDSATVTKVQAFLASDLGRRMVAADVAAAAVGDDNIDKIMNGELAAPSTPKRDLIIEKMERAIHSTESQVQVYLSMGEAVAIGTAIGSGQDPAGVAERARKTGEASRAGLEESMRVPMRKILAYGYRTLSDADLKHLLAFLDSPAGKRYVSAYNASMQAGYSAMGERTGEQLGESLREMAQAQLEPAPDGTPPDIAAPADQPAAPH